MNEWKDDIYRFIRVILSKFLYLAPVRSNKITFINFNGNGYGCNPKYIAEEILSQNLEYDLVWLLEDLNSKLPSGIRKIQYWGFRSLYELASSKVIVTNVKNELFLVKKKNQYIIQTWHSSYSPKLVEKEAEEKLSPKYIEESKKNSRQSDLFLSNSKILSKCYRDAFWCQCEILECGFPRNDILFSEDMEQEIERIKKSLGMDKSHKIVLYAPTFRDDGSTDAYNLDCKKILDVLGAEWKMIIRLHPNAASKDNIFTYDERVINASFYPDMQELLIVSDILITDYSSTVFDFSILKKSSYIFATDVERYKKTRGLNHNFDVMPFTICKTNKELIELIKQYSPELGEKKAEEFIELYGGVDKGDASKQVVARIRQVISDNSGK